MGQLRGHERSRSSACSHLQGTQRGPATGWDLSPQFLTIGALFTSRNAKDDLCTVPGPSWKMSSSAPDSQAACLPASGCATFSSFLGAFPSKLKTVPKDEKSGHEKKPFLKDQLCLTAWFSAPSISPSAYPWPTVSCVTLSVRVDTCTSFPAELSARTAMCLVSASSLTF